MTRHLPIVISLGVVVTLGSCRIGYDPVTTGLAGGGRAGSSAGSNQAQGGTSGQGLTGGQGPAGGQPTAGDSNGGAGIGGASSAGAGIGGASSAGAGTAGEGGAAGEAAGAGESFGGVANDGGSQQDAGGANDGGANQGGSLTNSGGTSGGGTSSGGTSNGGTAGSGGVAPGCSAAGAYVTCPTAALHDAAEMTCASMGMRLIRVDTPEENAWLAMEMGDSWLGASDAVVEGEWRWADGTLFWLGDGNGSAQNGLFTAWTPLAPSPAPPAGDCARMDGRNATWVDVLCTTNLPYACEAY